jgi:hypothetical protein
MCSLDNAGQNIGGSCGAMALPRTASRHKGVESRAGCAQGVVERSGPGCGGGTPRVTPPEKGPPLETIAIGGVAEAPIEGIPESPPQSALAATAFLRLSAARSRYTETSSLRYATKRIYAAPLYRTIQSTEPPPAALSCHVAWSCPAHFTVNPQLSSLPG